MRTAVFCAVLAVALSPGGASAQSLNLTEAEALARLSPDSPQARAARSGIDVARADVRSAGRWPNPRITWDRESVSGVTENMVMVAQPLPITGRRGFEVQAASALAGATSSRADEEIRRLRTDLQLAFADLVAAQTRERELTDARDRLGMLAEVLARREAAGDAAGFDRMRAEREVLDVDVDRALAGTERIRAQTRLARFFVDGTDPTRIVAVAPSSAPAELPGLDALVQRAESTRGELLALKQEADAAGFAQQAADRRKIPEPEVVAGTKSSNAAGGDIGSVVTLHASLPLFDRGKPERALAAAKASQAEARTNAFRVDLRTEISVLRTTVVERRALANRFRAEALNSSNEIERIAQVSYDAGERGILELLDAYRSSASARLRQAALDATVRQAEIELEFVSGWEIR